MTDATPTPSRRRSPAKREADHAELAALAESLVPALVARLTASGLGELELHEDDWRIRLRRPIGPAHAPAGRRGERLRGSTTAAGHGTAAGGPSFADPAHQREDRAPGGAGAAPDPGHGPPAGESAAEHGRRDVALSPAVGIFRPEAPIGTRVRAGDRVAVVDLLGIPQEVVAPADGTVVDVFVEAGDAVEYGEPVVVVELDPATEA